MYTDTSLAVLLPQFILGLAKFGLVFLAIWIPLETLIRAFSWKNLIH